MLPIRRNKGGYSAQIYEEFLGGVEVRVLLGAGPQPMNKFENNRPTDEIINQKLDFYFVGAGTQPVKFPADFQLDNSIKDMSAVELVNPTAIQFRNKIYIKADDLKPAK